jgi:hypothetical protein
LGCFLGSLGTIELFLALNSIAGEKKKSRKF